MSPSKKNKKSHSKKKTPAKKNSNENSDPNVEMESLRDLLKRKWRVFRVSPLHNFSVNKFRFYEKKLNEGMNSLKKMTVSCKSKISLNEILRLNGEQGAEGIKVEVIRDDSQRIYMGHFISWNGTKDLTNGSINFPLLLVDAREEETRGVHHVFSKVFDCDIQPVTFSFCALISFFVKLLDIPRNGSEAVPLEQIFMEYKVPNCGAKDKIKITLCLEETLAVFAVVMDSLHEKFQDITTMEIIWEFYNKILNHIYNIYKMDLMLAELNKITFPDAFMTADGQIKVTTAEAAVCALNVLKEFTPLEAITNV